MTYKAEHRPLNGCAILNVEVRGDGYVALGIVNPYQMAGTTLNDFEVEALILSLQAARASQRRT